MCILLACNIVHGDWRPSPCEFCHCKPLEWAMFTRERVVGNSVYIYEEHRWREGGKVRSKSIYKGKRHLFGIDWKATLQSEPGAAAQLASEERANETLRKEREEKTQKAAQEIPPAPAMPEPDKENAPPDGEAQESSSDLETGDL
jgi:hypothetical protein